MEALATTLASRLDPSRGPGVVIHLLALLELVVGGGCRKSAVLTPSVSKVVKGVICLPRGRGGRGLMRHDDFGLCMYGPISGVGRREPGQVFGASRFETRWKEV